MFQEFFQAIWHILLELAPWLFVGALIAGVLHVFVPEHVLRRHLTGRWGVIKGALIGVPMPLCSCSVIPVAMGLRQQGASSGATVAFLISTPETGVDSIFVSAGFLGWPFAIFKFASAFVLGLTGGMLTEARAEKHDSRVMSLPVLNDRARPRGVGALLGHSLELLRSMWVWLVIGVLASAAISYFLPAGGLERFNVYGGVGAFAAALAIVIPLYVCALASVPIAAALIEAGFPPGAALVFLIAGPATNLATMGAVYRTLGGRTLAIYLSTIAVGSVVCGIAFDWVIPHDMSAVGGHEHHDSPAWWATACALLLLGLVGKFAWDDATRWFRSRAAAPLPAGNRVEVAVTGMTCGNCVAKLERTLGREAGVAGVTVTLDPGRAVVVGAIGEPRVRELIAAAGFEAR
jgi:uncharacterized membrane protein YraQ (UPF0718 family)/copper chaperone CopZ